MRRNNLIRMLIMFGPMIYNGISRFWNDRKRQQSMAPPQRTAREENHQEYEETEPEVEKPTYKDEDMV